MSLIKLIEDSGVSQFDIFTHYMRVDIADIEYCLENTLNKIRNPLRDDKKPSLGFKLQNTKYGIKLRCKDFACSIYNGDCYDIAALTLNKNIYNKEDFVYVCNDIINSLVFNKENNSKLTRSITVKNKVITEQKTIQYFIELKDWTTHDFMYWHQYSNDKEFSKVLLDTLFNSKVYVVKKISTFNNVVYEYRLKDRCYVYYLGKDEHNIDIIKAYFPDRLKVKNVVRFITNGHSPIEDNKNYYCDRIIYVKSQKERILTSTLSFYGGLEKNLNIKVLQSESIILNSLDYNNEQLYSDKKTIMVLDYDKQGLLTGFYYKMLDPNLILLYINGLKFENIIFTYSEITSIVNKTAKLLNKDLDVMDFTSFCVNYKYRPYFKGLKDIADLFKVKGFRYVDKLYKLIINYYETPSKLITNKIS